MSGTKPVAPTANDSASKLPAIMNPFMEAFATKIIAANTAANLETQQMVQTVIVRMDLLEKLVAGAKKTATPKVKATEGAAPADGAQAPVVNAKFPTNKLIWFRSEFKNEAFRARYVTPAIADLMEADASISSKKGDQKIVAQGTFCWNWIKNNDAATGDRITQEFSEAQKAHEAAQKQVQVAETHTPPGELAQSPA